MPITVTSSSVTPNTVTSGGFTYALHTFVGSGSITLAGSGTIDVLLVGGGGGASLAISGAKSGVGGGGAGGVLVAYGLQATPGTYTVTVGSGGTNTTVTAIAPTTNKGNDSSVFGLIAQGGGAAGDNYTGDNGGSGGGAGAGGATLFQNGNTIQSIYTSATAFGNKGGNAVTGLNTGGGGGGAGARGSDYNFINGNGGIGIINPFAGSVIGQSSNSVYWLAGGGGAGSYNSTAGLGGLGGGGFGTTGDLATGNGATNTGGGGGGNGHTSTTTASRGGTGGSGVVIVRVTTATTPGLYTNPVGGGTNAVFSLYTTNLINGTNVPYTMNLVNITTSQVITPTTGTITVTGNTGILTVPTSSNIYGGTITLSANGFITNANVTFANTNAPDLVYYTSAQTLVPRQASNNNFAGTISLPMDITYSIDGQMNVAQSVLTTNSHYTSGNSAYTVNGQMDIVASNLLGLTNNYGLSPNTQYLLVTTSNLLSNVIVPFFTMTTSANGAWQYGLAKPFGDLIQKEYWL